jgi:NADH-quinone oxidoreductase subunit G
MPLEHSVMTTIWVDGRTHEVDESQNLLQAVLALGYDLPYFCWHPKLGSAGACRQCAVKQFRNAEDSRGMIVMACMTPVTEGLRISIDDPEAKEFRASVIGWLMTNHPHDCPVCDEGGECHLQDMTVMTGHTHRRYRFTKRTFRNQDLGPFLNHEMNRCIQCYRCVRFYRDFAGGQDFNVFGSRNKTYFGRFESGTLESPFSGNLAEICPTGVFTDKTERAHFTRKWDLQTAPSVCMLCGLGCNTLPGARSGTLRRVRNRYHGEVNGYFLCDRGRFGYEFVNSAGRIRHPVLREPGGAGPEQMSAERAVDRVATLLRGSNRAIGIGSPRASLEANFALRHLVGPENFFIGIDGRTARQLSTLLTILREGAVRTPSLRDVERADAILVLGQDLTNAAPLLDLAVRQAVLNMPKLRARALGIPDWNDAVVRLVVGHDRGPLFVATPAATPLDDIATAACRATPQDIARLGFAVAHVIDPGAPPVAGLHEQLSGLAETIASSLLDATSPLVIAGLGWEGESVLQAAANVARALRGKKPSTAVCFVVPDCNTVGTGLLGAGHLTDAATLVEQGDADTVVVLETDLYRRERHDRVDRILDTARHVVVLDHLSNRLTERAEVILPGATFAESGGTVVNNEGRAQRTFPVMAPEGDVRPSWQWLQEVADAVHRPATARWESPDDVARSLADEIPIFSQIATLTPDHGHWSTRHRVPRQSHRFSGRTALDADRQMSEPRPPVEPGSVLAYSMEGCPRTPPPPLTTRYWSPGWNSVQSLTEFQEEIGGALRGGDPGVRLIEPVPEGGHPFFNDIPEGFTPRSGEWLVVAVHHLFGSERLSLETRGVAERAPAPYIALSPADASGLGAEPGDTLAVELDGRVLQLPLELAAGLAPGCAAVPHGLPGLPPLLGRQWAKLQVMP